MDDPETSDTDYEDELKFIDDFLCEMAEENNVEIPPGQTDDQVCQLSVLRDTVKIMFHDSGNFR